MNKDIEKKEEGKTEREEQKQRQKETRKVRWQNGRIEENKKIEVS